LFNTGTITVCLKDNLYIYIKKKYIYIFIYINRNRPNMRTMHLQKHEKRWA